MTLCTSENACALRPHPKSLSFQERDSALAEQNHPFSWKEKGPGDEFEVQIKFFNILLKISAQCQLKG
jgi:hypothetical protein